MIILHSKKSVIYRVPKTGSTSLEASIRFANCISDEDICTNVGDCGLPYKNFPEEYSEYLNKNAEFYKSMIARKKQCVKDEKKFELTKDEIEYNKRQIDSRIYPFYKTQIIHHNISDFLDNKSWSILNLLTEEQIKEYKHYAVIRNPLKRFLSSFLYSAKLKAGGYSYTCTIKDLEEAVESGRAFKGLASRRQIDYFRYDGELERDGKMIVTPLLFENLNHEMGDLIKNLGGNVLMEYPKFKGSNKSIFKTTEDYPTVEGWILDNDIIKNKVFDFYNEDIELWERVSGSKVI